MTPCKRRTTCRPPTSLLIHTMVPERSRVASQT
ncbi:uncharacterized protein HMPREF1541_07393 [Cyphellophora europaea CBS 101466]|uniref:Uncharacterized protein n=1 Tax=Cyphellophora europaea (strain CBS 101466) TaxID=1220924 RepID=W2RN53_CYPE1|nr:uncharacterized protein HMPREF1541_07393 [Cyphellophora europaea CBS 101466]ETN37770.1 hypothetical protein HMPREF1541_07393 [Cyphellophora europaea CBS 101466]